MEFNREVFDLMPPSRKTFNLVGVKIPNDKDIFFEQSKKKLWIDIKPHDVSCTN